MLPQLLLIALGAFASETRRRMVGFLRRKLQWEFWPAWLAYLPLAPYLLLLAIRHRSLTLFTAANPGIPSGGFVGESKSAILKNLSAAGEIVAEWRAIPAALTPSAKLAAARQFIEQRGLTPPVVLKPDVGERGSGVDIVRSAERMEEYLHAAEGTVILQRYVPGLEFGVFYYRYPHEARGRIFSITEKRFPHVTGNGHSSLRQLILGDQRAVCMASAYAQAARRPLDDIPASGERVKLVELGSHCRGAIFLDGMRYNTPALEHAIDAVSQAHAGFFFGRFDIRTPSLEAFQRGEFKVIELNGVSAEAAHIYDPSVSLLEAYRVLAQQWRIAFEIGAANRALGAAPMSLRELLRLVSNKLSVPANGSNPQHPAPAEERPAAS